MTGQLDFTNECGVGVGGCEIATTFDKVLTWKVDGIPINLTSATAKMQVRNKIGGTIIVELSTTNNRIILGGVLGTIELFIDKVDTVSLPVGSYVYDLLITMGSEVEKLIEGKFHIYSTVTRT